MKNISAKTLKKQLDAQRDTMPPDTALRLHRAISWIAAAQKNNDDEDAKFIFLWVAFTALYTRRPTDSERQEDELSIDHIHLPERKSQFDFFNKIVRSDTDNIIYNAIWEKFSGPVRNLMSNQYVFDPFWQSQEKGEEAQSNSWEESMERQNAKFHKAFEHQATDKVLGYVFIRLYTLRNQIVHGGATHQSSVNRQQVRGAVAILEFLAPLFAHLMLSNFNEEWGTPYYPPVDN